MKPRRRRSKRFPELTRCVFTIPPNRMETFIIGGQMITVQTGKTMAKLIYCERESEPQAGRE